MCDDFFFIHYTLNVGYDMFTKTSYGLILTYVLTYIILIMNPYE